MVITLLVVIILILLFGGAFVLAAASRAVGFCALVIIATVIWVWLRRYVTIEVIGITAVAMLALSVGLKWKAHSAIERTRAAQPPRPRHRFDPPAADAPAEPRAVDRVWGWFAKEIPSFNPDAQAEAKRLFDANDAHGLDRFCRSKLNP